MIQIDLLNLLLLFWAFRLRLQLRRRAFRYIFARSAIASFAKDAAPIPNAKGQSDPRGNNQSLRDAK